MVDKVIGELPSISSLDDESLFVAEQNGQAVKVSGKQLTDFSNVETTAQVEQAKASAQAAKTAQEAAEAAIIKSPIIQNGTWWVYNQTAGAYQDTGIEATGPQGIPGPTASVNGISPDASGNITLTASNVNAYSKTETDTLLQKKAEGGYGFGGDAQQLTFASDEDFMNWVSSLGSKTMRNFYSASVHLTYLYNYRMQMLIVSSQTADMQELSILALTYDGYLLTRYRDYYENWKPWEWVRPPMLLGVEYRTTERYLGKPVYAKTVDFGVIPNTTTKWVSFSDDTNVRAIRANAVFNEYNVIPGMSDNADEYMMEVGTLGQTVGIKTYRNWGNYPVKATVHYWKTTD